MKKALGIVLVFVIGFTFGVAQVYACGASEAAKTSSSKSSSCGGSVEAKLISADAGAKKCPMSGKTIDNAKADCSPEECAEMAKFCESYDGNCDVRKISIKGMTCGDCENSVKTSLMKVDGVLKVVKVSYEKGMAVVCIDPDKTTNDNITSAISNRGFEAEIIPAVAKTTDQSGNASSVPGACCAKGGAKQSNIEGSK